MTASLTRLFGVHNLALAEDVVQDAFCRALEVWKIRGVPPNPSAWLMTTARNRALDLVRRERTARTFAPDLTRLLETEWTAAAVVDEAFSSRVMLDEQLRMMFSCCHPDLTEPAQIALILNILCGFGAAEIAAAFLTGRAAIEKRISRGKKVLAGSQTLFDLADGDFASRLSAVHRALYLLFSEGYHGASAEGAVRIELCDEAMRLVALLAGASGDGDPGNECARGPDVVARRTDSVARRFSRRAARAVGSGSLALGSRADRRGARAARPLGRRATELTPYHIEAAIAAVHATAPSLEQTDWNAIVGMYDRLMTVAPSPVVALNRAIAIAQRDGPAQGIAAIERIEDRERLEAYPFYPAALGELEARRGKRCACARALQGGGRAGAKRE